MRSVDSLLRSHFGRRDGLASTDVHILDPATGTGSFLLAVVEQIYETMRGQRGIWPDYVRRQLLPRLHGFELLMAPYTLAHMRLGLYLGEKGCPLGEDDRLNILLTNSLDRGVKKEEQLWEDHIVAEANAAAEVKNDKPIMVVLGNPPYSVESANKGDWIRKITSRLLFGGRSTTWRKKFKTIERRLCKVHPFWTVANRTERRRCAGLHHQSRLAG